MANEPVTCRIEGRTARIRIDRAEAGNSLSLDTIRGLGRSLAEVESSRKKTSVVVLESAGDGAFCAGADLRSLHDFSGTETLAGTERYAELLRGIRRIGCVVICRVQGAALGGGLGLVLASDLAIASNKARFGTPEVGVGLFPMMVLAPLIRHLPPKILGHLVFTAEPMEAAEAYRWGLVNQVVDSDDSDDLDDAVDDLIEKVLRGNPTAIAQGRRALYRCQDLPYEAAVEYLRGMLDLLWRTGEAEEGIRAFLERRNPAWLDSDG